MNMERVLCICIEGHRGSLWGFISCCLRASFLIGVEITLGPNHSMGVQSRINMRQTGLPIKIFASNPTFYFYHHNFRFKALRIYKISLQ